MFSSSSAFNPPNSGLFSGGNQPALPGFQSSVLSTNQPNTTATLFNTQQQPSTMTFGSSLFGAQQQQPSTTSTSGTSLFGAHQPSTTPSTGSYMFGNQPSGGAFAPQSSSLFGNQKAASSSLFASQEQAPGNYVFGTQQLSGNTIFTNTQQPFANSSFYGTSQQSHPFTNEMNSKNFQSSAQIIPEVQKILENINNADLRSYQILTDTFQRLKCLSTEPPMLVAFTYEIETDQQALANRRATLEQQVAALNNPNVCEAFARSKINNPDPAKYVIVPIQGLEGIVSRTKLQSQHLEQLNLLLQEMKTRQEAVRNHLKINCFKRYQDIIKRQRQLMLGVMRTVGQLEEHALKNSMAQIDVPFMKKLQSDLTILTDEFQHSPAGRIALAQTATNLQTLLNNVISLDTDESSVSKPVLGTTSEILNKLILQRKETLSHEHCDLSEKDFRVLQKIIQKQDTLCESLETALYIDHMKTKKLLQIVENANNPNSV